MLSLEELRLLTAVAAYEDWRLDRNMSETRPSVAPQRRLHATDCDKSSAVIVCRIKGPPQRRTWPWSDATSGDRWRRRTTKSSKRYLHGNDSSIWLRSRSHDCRIIGDFACTWTNACAFKLMVSPVRLRHGGYTEKRREEDSEVVSHRGLRGRSFYSVWLLRYIIFIYYSYFKMLS